MPIHLSIFERTNKSFGGATHDFAITNLLQRAQPDFGPGLVEIYVELVLRAPSRIKTPIEADEVIMGTRVADLPTGKLSTKAKRYSLAALSHRPGNEPLQMSIGVPLSSLEEIQRHCEAQQAEIEERQAELARRQADVGAVPRLFDEVADVMAANPPRLKRGTFNWVAFVVWFKSLKAELPTTLDGIKAANEAGHAAVRRRYEAMDPWACLEINWKSFHPKARTLLPEPFFWSRDDDFAPHGNDEGFDILAEMRKRSHKGAFTDDTFASMAAVFGHANADEIANTDDGDPARYLDFIIAVAFGHIKLNGCCPPWLRDMAVVAMAQEISRLDALIDRDHSGAPLSARDTAAAPYRAPKRDSLRRLIGALERLTNGSSS